MSRISRNPRSLDLLGALRACPGLYKDTLTFTLRRGGVETSWNVMVRAQKPDFVFRRNGRVQLNRRGEGNQFNRILAAEVCASAVVMLDTPCSEVVWRVLATHPIRQFPPSLPLPCVTVCRHVLTGVYVSLPIFVGIFKVKISRNFLCSVIEILTHSRLRFIQFDAILKTICRKRH